MLVNLCLLVCGMLTVIVTWFFLWYGWNSTRILCNEDVQKAREIESAKPLWERLRGLS